MESKLENLEDSGPSDSDNWSVPEAGVLSDGISIKDSPESLPEWWEKRKTGLGRTYYVDHITRTTAWDLPSSGSAVVLPEWWEWRQNNLGRTYYVNHKTRTTTWVPPPVTTYDDIQRGVVEYVQSAEKYEISRPDPRKSHCFLKRGETGEVLKKIVKRAAR